jgi:RimJ/RimL family protein N-acetyltransferase
VEEDNARAVALYRSFGFQPEGRLRQAAFCEGRFGDVLLFSLLAAEWAERGVEETGRSADQSTTSNLT